MSDLQINSISQVKQFGEMSLDFRKMELLRGGQPVQITLREFKVLKFLVCRPRPTVAVTGSTQRCVMPYGINPG